MIIGLQALRYFSDQTSSYRISVGYRITKNFDLRKIKVSNVFCPFIYIICHPHLLYVDIERNISKPYQTRFRYRYPTLHATCVSNIEIVSITIVLFVGIVSNSIPISISNTTCYMRIKYRYHIDCDSFVCRHCIELDSDIDIQNYMRIKYRYHIDCDSFVCRHRIELDSDIDIQHYMLHVYQISKSYRLRQFCLSASYQTRFRYRYSTLSRMNFIFLMCLQVTSKKSRPRTCIATCCCICARVVRFSKNIQAQRRPLVPRVVCLVFLDPTFPIHGTPASWKESDVSSSAKRTTCWSMNDYCCSGLARYTRGFLVLRPTGAPSNPDLP